MFLRSTLAAAALFVAGAAEAAVTISIGAPGAQTTARALRTGGVETFDRRAVAGASTFATNFGGSAHSATIGSIVVDPVNQYGGAGGIGNYARPDGTSSITLTNGAIDYFGLWVSALDANNTIAFFDNGTEIGRFNLTSTLNALPNAAAYRGNPNANFAGQNGGEAYAFIDFTSDTRFDRIDLVQNGGGGFELDNLTVGTIAAVPEPATWGLMILGFGVIGSAARRRRDNRRLAVAA